LGNGVVTLLTDYSYVKVKDEETGAE